MVRACCIHDHKPAVRHAHLKLVDQPPTKVRMLIPFPILLLYCTNLTTYSTLPLYVSVFPGLFIFFSPTYALHAAEIVFAVLSAVTQEEPYAAQMFRNIRTAILSAITIRRNTFAAHTFRNVGTLPRSPCMPHAGSMLAKYVSYCLHLSRTWSSLKRV